jgi:hypothetical protein
VGWRSCEKGGARKIDTTMKTNLKRQVPKYPIMTATKLQTSAAELRVVSEWIINLQALPIDLKMPSRVAAMKLLLTEKMKAK